MVSMFARKMSFAMVAALVLGLPAVASAVELKFRADFTATAVDPLADGHADFKLDTVTGVKELSFEVEDVASTTQALAFVNGRFVGTLNIVNGFADLNLASNQGDSFPRVKTGMSAEVRRASDGALILFGTFQPD